MAPRSTAHLRARLLAGVVAAAALVAGARSAEAQVQILDLPTPAISPPPLTGDIEQLGKRAFWRAGKQRWFFSSTVELGNIYVRGSGALGYGKPHWSWLGIEGSSVVAPGGGVMYGGVRLAAPYIDLRAGARHSFTMGSHFLPPQETYTKDDLDLAVGPKLHYLTLEAEVAGGYPLFGGAMFGIFGVYHPTGTPEGWNFFDQTLQIVAAPPLLWRARAGYLKSVDKWDMMRLGAAVEAVGNPARDVVIVRVGPTITALITHHLEAYGSALMLVHTRDPVGTAGSQFGEIGFRYRWATGDRWPEFP